jgi:Ca2+/Na+ antiporter
MFERLNLIGALTAHVVFISSIITFSSRMIFKIGPGHWVGIPLLLMVFPLGYLLFTAPVANRPFLYYIQAGLMLLFIILLFFVDYVFKYDFRQTQWMVISFVVFYFAGMGGMIGVASLAGRGWTISSVILFILAAILAFVQRAVTGY